MINEMPAKTGNWLAQYARDINTQSGEDGILEKILEIIGERDGWCVEFGAWDGIHFSNTRYLLAEKGYNGVLIEADPVRFEELKTLYKGRDEMVLINAFVGFTQATSLDMLLNNTKIPHNYDVLSIDIDGNDYHVWAATEEYRPKVIIEFNPTVPNEVEYVQAADPRLNRGCSVLSLVKLGKQKGYELVATTRFNAIFVDAKYYDRFGIADNAVAVMRADDHYVTYIFQGMDGRVFMQGHGRMLWHNMPIHEPSLQQLPALFHAFPDNMNPVQRFLFKVYRKLRGVLIGKS